MLDLKTSPGGWKKAANGIADYETHRGDPARPISGHWQAEPLRHELAGCWSRRIDDEHRLIYQVLGDKIRILAGHIALLRRSAPPAGGGRKDLVRNERKIEKAFLG